MAFLRSSRRALSVALCLLPLACNGSGWERSHRRALPVARAHAPRPRSCDILHYRIELELLPEERAIRGTCRIRLQPLERALADVSLDLRDLEVEAVQDERGRALSYRHEDGVLAVRLADELAPGVNTELVVRYSGRPRAGLWFAGERPDGSGPTLVFSQGQTEESRSWFPCYDAPAERATSEVVVTIPPGWTSVAAGERVSSVLAHGRRTEHWRMDFAHPTYLESLVAGELHVEESQADGVPLYFLAEPQYSEWVAPTFAETGAILSFLAEFTARPYPYAKYSQAVVDNFPGGGMENISATTLTPLVLFDEIGRLDAPAFPLLAHEAAHQWFGDLFTCADWSHLWLNEGFATYLSLLYLERTRGEDAFRAALGEAQDTYLGQDVGAARRPIVWNVWKEPDDVFDSRPYQGAAARLHLLRFELGDEAFQDGVRAYVAASEGRSVVTADFQRAMEASSGRDLDLFFGQWFTARGYPEFQVEWEWNEDERRVELQVDQVQESADGTPAVFQVPFEVELCDAGAARVTRLECDERRERYHLPCPQAPQYLLFDPRGWIPKRVQEDKRAEECLALARGPAGSDARRRAMGILGRHAAEARILGDPACEEYALEIEKRLCDDDSPWVRAEAAAALAVAGGAGARDALSTAALRDGETRVRVAALHALRVFAPDAGLSSLAEDAFAAAASYQVMAAAAALLCSAAPERAFEWLISAMEIETPHDVLAARLLFLLAALDDARVPAELRRSALDPSLAPATRAIALDQLAAIQDETGTGAAFLGQFLEHPSFALRRSALRSLAARRDSGAYRTLEAYYPRARTSEERRIVEAHLERPTF